jgi:hypothetical protein
MQSNYVWIMLTTVLYSTLRQEPSLVSPGNMEFSETLQNKEDDEDNKQHIIH